MAHAAESQTDESTARDLEKSAEDLLSGCLQRAEVRAEIADTRFSPTAWKAVAEAGWFQVLLPEEYGGLGLGLTVLGGIMSVAGRHLLPGPLVEHVGVAPLLVPHATGAGAERLLSAIEGHGLVVLADQAATGTCTEMPRLDGGVLSGSVQLVRFADRAQNILVVTGEGTAESVGHAGIALVSASGLGVSIQREVSFDPCTTYATVEFDACPVEVVVLSPGRRADRVLSQLRSTIRLLIAGEIAGVVASLLENSVAYARDRVQFGRPIGSFQAVQHLLADMATQVHQIDASVRDGFARSGGGDGPSEYLACRVKALCSDLSRGIGESAFQVHGGIAFTQEHGLHRAVQHVLALQGYYGDENYLARRLGRALITGELATWADE